jgi:hypothetical protein
VLDTQPRTANLLKKPPRAVALPVRAKPEIAHSHMEAFSSEVQLAEKHAA